MKKLTLVVIATIMVMSVGASAQASLTMVTSNAGMADSVDWGSLGLEGTEVTSPAGTTSNHGLSLTVSIPAGQMVRADEGSDWSGNFSSGDRLLYYYNDYANVGSMMISFSNPIRGVGANIQTGPKGPFTGYITAYDSSNNLLGSFSANGNSNETLGTAIFLGVLSSASDIKTLAFSVSLPDSKLYSSFAINGLSVSNVPLPGALFLLGSGLIGIGAIRRRIKM